MFDYLYHEKEVTIASEYKLSGTLTLPDEPEKVPAILFIHGSGPLDRDGNSFSLNMEIFNQMAIYFAKKGYASLRYDKRGIGKSEGDFMHSGLWDLAADAQKGVEFLKNHPSVNPNKIILLGHSEGCMIAPLVHQENPVAGMIMVSGACENLKETMRRQSKLLSGELSSLAGLKGYILRKINISKKIAKQQELFIRKVENSSEEILLVKRQPVNAKWFREHFQYDVSALMPLVKCPVLELAGTKDVQAPNEQVGNFIAKSKGDKDYRLIKDMNHLLRKQSEDASLMNIQTLYRESVKKPVDEEMLTDIQQWLYKHFF